MGQQRAWVGRLAWFVGAAALGGGVIAALNGCSTTYPNRDPVGEVFPSVEGESLEEVATALPESLAGKPAVLLVGYRQKTQFDIDRWLMGLLQAGVGTADCVSRGSSSQPLTAAAIASASSGARNRRS